MRRAAFGCCGTTMLALLLAACGRGAERMSDDRLGLRFEQSVQPEVFSRAGAGARAAPQPAPGLWAVVADLPRPERAEIVHLATGARTSVALFEGDPGAGVAVRLSGAAADALGIGEDPAPVRVTAQRREPRLDPRGDVF